MGLYVWRHDLDPEFPLSVIEYDVSGTGDQLHWHDHLEIALCLDGRGTFHFGPRPQPAEPGDIFLVDNTEPHVGLPDPDGHLRLLLVLFRPELLAPSGCRTLDAGYLLPFRSQDGTSSHRVAGSSRLAAQVAPMLLELRDTWNRHDPDDRLLLDAGLRRPLALLARHRLPSSGAEMFGVVRPESLRPAIEFVDANFREHLTLADVARHVHTSESRLRHVFKEATGHGFREYLANVRLSEAKRLLLASDASVSEIAASVSYTNLRQFYVVFRRFCGMSPAEYRRAYAGTRWKDAALSA